MLQFILSTGLGAARTSCHAYTAHIPATVAGYPLSAYGTACLMLHAGRGPRATSVLSPCGMSYQGARSEDPGALRGRRVVVVGGTMPSIRVDLGLWVVALVVVVSCMHARMIR